MYVEVHETMFAGRDGVVLTQFDGGSCSHLCVYTMSVVAKLNWIHILQSAPPLAQLISDPPPKQPHPNLNYRPV